MPETTTTHVPDSSAPPIDAKPPKRVRKARKPKAPTEPKPPRTRRERTEPVRTLKYLVGQMGENHAEAFRILSKRDGQFEDGLRAELGRGDKARKANARLLAAESALKAAKADYDEAVRGSGSAPIFLKRLDAFAHDIATATGDTSATPSLDLNAAD